MKKRNWIVVAILAVICLSSCGVSDSNDSYLGEAPLLAGAWKVVMVPFPDAASCAMNAKGFAILSPFDIPNVTQTGYNLSSTFDLGGQTVALTGIAAFGGAEFVIEDLGTFIESFIGAQVGGGIVGSFNGQELPSGCGEKGVFVAAIGDTTDPAVAGTWDMVITGTASNCTDPADAGAFTKTIAGISTTSPATYLVGGTYEDPAAVTNVIAGVAMGTSFAAGVIDANSPPTRTASLLGAVDTVNRIIAGTATGTLAFAGGNCEISNATFAIQY